MRMLRRALEETSDGIAFKEIEYEYYCRLTDLSQLEKADSKEHHEQWEIQIPKTDENAGKGRNRIRMTKTEDGKIEYVHTTKSVLIKDDARIEVSIPTTEHNFKQYKVLSGSGMIKDRYFFPVGDIIFEVDMFIKPEGGYHEWCKIDIEVTSREIIIPDLPFNVEDLITSQKADHTVEEDKLIKSLYDNAFITRNVYL